MSGYCDQCGNTLCVCADVEDQAQAHAEAVKAMWELQRDVGRKAMQKAMEALDQIDVAEIPSNVAVQLLKLGADMERRAVLGIEPDGDDDPFSALAGALG